MSEMIRNNTEKQKILKEIVFGLHEGSDIRKIKKQFKKVIQDVSPEEIAAMEQSLIDEGVPVSQVQSLCDIHVQVFEDTLSRNKIKKAVSGHPVHTYKAENKYLKNLIAEIKREFKKIIKGKEHNSFSVILSELKMVEIHYQRKENQLFPFLESVDFTGPSRVMWGKHDEIRVMLKDTEEAFLKNNIMELRKSVKTLTKALSGMIFMEEKILYPAALRKLPENSWKQIRTGESEIGYAWIKPGNLWDPDIINTNKPDILTVPAEADNKSGQIPLNVGNLTGAQINMMLKVLPVDISYVDENDRVLYYSQGKERLFPRSPGIIGRTVQNCHPPKSAHIVQKIIDSFKKKEKSEAEFYFTMNGRFLHIRYYPVYDDKGVYKGTIEVGQDVTDIRALSGKKKLLDF